MTTKTRQESKTKAETSYKSFDLKDRLGRIIGASATTWEVTMVEFTPETPYVTYSTLAPGRHFMLETQATRDAVGYQAFRRKAFPTAEARDKAIAKYFADAAKRAVKREGK